MLTFLQILLAYAVADAIVGLFHLVTDRGYNFKRVVNNFLNHHDHPETMTFDLEPVIGGLPILIFGVWLESVFVVALGFFLCFSQVPHYYSHFPAPKFVQFLQKIHLFTPPQKHADHHNGLFDRNYCVTTGWSDWWINWIARKTC